MYPGNFLNLFPAFPRENKVFVAMSFAPVFDRRWNEVIAPAVRRVQVGSETLEAYRVDVRRVCDSILTEILTGIAQARLVLADITTLGYLEGKPFRNGNVMYEIGLAHAVRLPEEVLLFRSDADHLLFDVSNVRVNSYDPDNDPSGATELVVRSILEALNEIDLKKNLAVKSAADALDYTSWLMLFQAAASGEISPPVMQTMGQALGNASRVAAISRLLELGALSTSYLTLSPDVLSTQQDQPAEMILKYRLTPFGNAMLEHVATRMGLFSSSVRDILNQLSMD